MHGGAHHVGGGADLASVGCAFVQVGFQLLELRGLGGLETASVVDDVEQAGRVARPDENVGDLAVGLHRSDQGQVSGFVSRGLARVFGGNAEVGEIDQWVVAGGRNQIGRTMAAVWIDR